MADTRTRQKVLFLCTHNSARSQMAEGLLRALYGDRYDVMSAGMQPAGINPLAIKVMEEIGIDITSYRSKSTEEFTGQSIDVVVTVCDAARESCPFFPFGQKSLHKSFADPAAHEGSEEEKLAYFRKIRDEIREWIAGMFGSSAQD